MQFEGCYVDTVMHPTVGDVAKGAQHCEQQQHQALMTVFRDKYPTVPSSSCRGRSPR
jgi:hypothetical protein